MTEFESAGFTILPNVIEPDLADRLIETWQDGAGTRKVLATMPVIRSIAGTGPLPDLATSLLGQPAFAVRGLLFDKTPEANWKVAWHQDLAISVKEQRAVHGFGPWSIKQGVPHVHAPTAILERMVALRLHLDDCDAHNGPLRVVPGTHLLGRLSAADAIRAASEHDTQTCQVPAGGILAMRPLLIHASSPATRPAHRRVIHLEFACGALPGGLTWDGPIA